MRVIAGSRRGATLRAPRGRDVRPTSDRVREALFSVLADVSEERVLDLFAGSGALGIEALSRGAASATFVDSSATALAAVRANLATLHLAGDVHALTAARFLATAREGRRLYDLVFIDPPYRQARALGPDLSAALPPVLSGQARVVVESDRRAPLDLQLPLDFERRYGDTLIRIHAPR
ncbi:MAG TPA: 16S rRNA (guanine(966)-N(2))-methyltransferase RsmD [Solirubrobacteraceae bacterium]|jgi:16S rRNA (guanine966-N2)-methyltransferase|nr:16S rRNA (guanine(966)-N(2))-methyltransferase RsmD [Solirubrobacteraceae bacterium]